MKTLRLRPTQQTNCQKSPMLLHARSALKLAQSVRTCSSSSRIYAAYSGSSLSSSSLDGGDAASSSPPHPESPLGKKHALVRTALQDGTLGLSFSAGGFLYCYHLGVLWELARLGILPPPDHPGALKMSGSSAGSLAIATYACGLDIEKSQQALFEFAADCRNNGTRGRLTPLVRDFLHAYLPDDAHERCRDLTYVYVTRVFPVWRAEVVHRFHDKSDLVEALVTSCHIPVYANGQWMSKFRGRYYMDGGVGAFIPNVPHSTAQVKVCCFPVNEMLSRVQPNLEGYPTVASLLDVSISPDKFETWPYSYTQLLQWALVPAEDEVLKYLMAKGRRDAHAWATNLNLVPAAQLEAQVKQEQPNQPQQSQAGSTTAAVAGGLAFVESTRKSP